MPCLGTTGYVYGQKTATETEVSEPGSVPELHFQNEGYLPKEGILSCRIGVVKLPNLRRALNEIVFLGVSSSASDGFPLVVGLGFPETQSMKVIFIRPPEEWGLIEVIKESGNGGTEETKLNPKIIEGIRTSDLISKGLAPDEATKIILQCVEGKSVYSVDPKQERMLIGKLGIHSPQAIELNSAIILFDSFVTPELEREMQLNTKMNLNYYPRNKSDIRWLIELYIRCCQRGRS